MFNRRATASALPCAESMLEIIVRFSTGLTSVDVTIDADNPAVRDFLAMLPLTLTVEEFAGREKLANAGSIHSTGALFQGIMQHMNLKVIGFC